MKPPLFEGVSVIVMIPTLVVYDAIALGTRSVEVPDYLPGLINIALIPHIARLVGIWSSTTEVSLPVASSAVCGQLLIHLSQRATVTSPSLAQI